MPNINQFKKLYLDLVNKDKDEFGRTAFKIFQNDFKQNFQAQF